MNKTLKYKGFLKIFNVEDENKNGVTINREVMSRATDGKSDDVVSGLLWDKEKDMFYLVKQYRAGATDQDRYLIEAVAGTLEEGEDPIECFKSESIEEVGFECISVLELGSFYTSPGGTTERVHLFLGIGSRTSEGGGLEEENEDIEVLEYGFDDLNSIDIIDLKTAYLINYQRLLNQTLPEQL